jgi:hypothetical protein
MIARYKNYVFKFGSKLGNLNRCEFLEYCDLPHDEYIKKFQKDYPNETKRTYNYNQGIPRYHLEILVKNLKDLPEYKKRERSKKLNEILTKIH